MLNKRVPETCAKWNTAVFGASFLYQKLSNTADLSKVYMANKLKTYCLWLSYLCFRLKSICCCT